MRPLILCAALAVAACAAPPLTPAEVARVRADDATRFCQAARASDAAACEAMAVSYSQEQYPYQPPDRGTLKSFIEATERCVNAGWAFGTSGLGACVENRRRELAEAARRRADAALILGAGMNAYATAPRPAPALPQQSHCRPDFLGGLRCTSY